MTPNSPSRKRILDQLRAADVPPIEIPASSVNAIQYDNPLQQFQQSLEFVGGKVIHVPFGETWQASVAALPVVEQAKRICSALPDFPQANVDQADVDDPHALCDVDVFIGRGDFGVAENGAVWISDQGLRHRVLYFLCQHLVLVVPSPQIVHNLHEAYARLSFTSNAFGAFISGPSKTADIEQSLVIGAHGARSLTVILS